MKSYFSIPNKEYSSEIEINKSRFLGFAKSVVSASEAEEYVALLRKKYVDARHVCFAYKLSSTAKMSDDGEPSGTAGKPILSVIENKGLENLVVVVVRYFGGIKLGAGGLLRAYVESATKTLDLAPKVEWENAKMCELTLGFSEYQKFLHSINGRKVQVLSADFSDAVKLSIVFGGGEDIQGANVKNTVWCFEGDK